MTTLFKITHTWKCRDKKLPFNEEDYVDATTLFLSLRDFLTAYEGQFLIHINNIDLRFDLDPDLSTVFEEIPEVLANLAQQEKLPIELHFYEQGTDISLSFERKIDTVFVEFKKGISSGKRFEGIPTTSITVPIDIFLMEWIQFAGAVLDALVTMHPNLIQEESYQNYISQLNALKSTI